MLAQELIDQLEKIKKDYPYHDVKTRNGFLVDRVEICNHGIELVMAENLPRYAGHDYKFKKPSRR